MSFDERNYGRKIRFGGSRPVGTFWLLGITFGLQALIWTFGGGVMGGGSSAIIDWFSLDESRLVSIEVWRFLTYAFLHGSTGHLIGNLLILFFIGGMLEDYFGTRAFVRYYLAFAAAAALGFVVEASIWPSAGAPMQTIGASGACMGLVALLGARFPMQQIMIWGVVPLRCWALAAILVVLDLLSISAYRGLDNTAHSVHLAGAFAGFWVGYLGERVRARFEDLKRARAAVEKRKAASERAKNSAEMDRILQKVHQSGMDALSEGERAFLLSQSARLKDKKRS